GTSFMILLVFLVSGFQCVDKVDFSLTDIMNIAQLIGLDESTAMKDSAVSYEKELKLLYAIAKEYQEKMGSNMNRKPPSGEKGQPLRIDPSFTINHVEALDEKEETMTVHGTVLLKWTDPFYTWDPATYNNIQVVSRSLSDYIPSFRPWTPSVNFRTADAVDNRKAEGFEGLGTILTVTYKGEMAMQKKFSVEAPCDFDYRDFPYDSQRCMLVLTAQHSFREVWFNYDSDQEKHMVRQLRTDGNSPMVGDFILDFVHVFNAIVKNDLRPEQIKGPWKDETAVSKMEKVKMAAVVTIGFTRLNDQYIFTYSLPLVACSIVAVAALFFDTKL
ncbi:hypothetical protein PMAYCL1PPCAC_30539, partial [Pristionchus mayeri]